MTAAVVQAVSDRAAQALDALGLPSDGDADARIGRLAAAAASADAAREVAWLAMTALLGRFPVARELAAVRRELLLAEDPAAGLLTATTPFDRIASGVARRMRIVTDRVLVDVGHTATSDHNTGIQRVVRRTLPEWRERPVELVAWTADDRGYRALTAHETDRVLAWGGPRAEAVTPDDDLVVPWRTTVVLPEVAMLDRCAPLACLAAESGSRVGLIGYDLIPLVSADLIDPVESDKTAHYLEVVKHADRVAGISASAASEFAGFVAALPAQGIAGPEVRTVALAEEPLAFDTAPAPTADGVVPILLSVGSHEPRKNQPAVLAAARILHEEGLAFRLVFVGGGSVEHAGPFDTEIAELARGGMAVESHRRLGDAELDALYRAARACVMVSLHEGYGLPVVEALGRGVPVLTSDYGSLAEIAAGGGCLTVDPRDVVAIADGLRRLLVDDALVGRLRAEALARPERTWRRYANELWDELVGGAA
ncbi:MAG: glycosyltransferase family 4 protein [Microbacteriaceae bacterium]|nr:glycosyltransferase family 4 protein [Microbacteriaceae bacterium]